MRAPAQLSRVAVESRRDATFPFPPLGFFPIPEGEVNGDTFGLYWPIGREQREPLVAQVWFDDWWLKPTYSSLDTFLIALDRTESGYVEPLSLDEDPLSPRMRMERAKELVTAGDLDGARELLEKAIELLPEYTDALTDLWSIHARLKRSDLAAPLAIRAIISPPCFGFRAFKPLRWLRTAQVPDEMHDDPIWKRRETLTLEFGGTKHNDNYPLLMGAIEEYLDQAKFEMAITLMQTYSEFMFSETTAFRDRYKFDRKEFAAWQSKVSAQLPGGPRDAFRL